MVRMRRWQVAGLATLVVTAATAAAVLAGARGGQGGQSVGVALPSGPQACEPLDPAHCLLPFPSDGLTVPDPGTDTGRRLNLPEQAPAGHRDTIVELNRGDGFSPGAPVVALLPGFDLAASGVASAADIGRSLDADAPIVILDTQTGQRHPYWAENDRRAPDGQDPLTFIRPAESFQPGHRYIVAIRDVVDGDGQPIEPSDMFRAYRDGVGDGVAGLDAERQEQMEEVFSSLELTGVGRDSLVLAWDFTVASERSLSERLMAMRDDAFAELGDDAPSFEITNVEDSHKETVRYEVRGTFEVPSYLTGDGSAGNVLNNGNGARASPAPERNGTITADFACVTPASAVDAEGVANPSRSALYGHALFSDIDELESVTAQTFFPFTNTTLCSTDWLGLAYDDLPFVLDDVLTGQTSFRTVPDRVQQGMLNFLFLGRLMLHPEGLSSHPVFQADDGTPLLDQESLAFLDNNQLGLGGAVSAFGQDWDRAFLGASGMNVSTFVDRSANLEELNAVSDATFGDWTDRQLGTSLLQMLWDRAEPTGHARHLTRDTYPDTPAKRVLLFQAFGDHQVPNVASEVMARTIGAQLRTPALEPGRGPDESAFWGIDRHEGGPSAAFLVVWDSSTPASPDGNVSDHAGEDPHSEPLVQPEAVEMVVEFLDRGTFVDTCGEGPCLSPILEPSFLDDDA